MTADPVLPRSSGTALSPDVRRWLEPALRGLGAVAYAHGSRSGEERYISPGWRTVLGHVPASLPQAADFRAWLLDRTHEEDRAALDRETARAAVVEAGSCDHTVRLESAAGEWKWVRVLCMPLGASAGGRAEAIAWILVDVDRERRAGGGLERAREWLDLPEVRDEIAAAAESVRAAWSVKTAAVDGLLERLRGEVAGTWGEREEIPVVPALSDRLEDEVVRLTREWHEELQQRLRIRPQSVFPGERLLDGMPEVVEWLVRALRNGRDPDPASLDSLRQVAQHWRDGGYPVEEALLHLRLLAGIMNQGLRDELRSMGMGAGALDAARAADQLWHALSLAELALVAAYRDAEEERFAEFGSTLAHELRGKLNAALGSLQVARLLEDQDAEGSSDRREGIYDRIEDVLDRTADFISSVQSVSRGAHAEQSEFDPVRLRAVVRQAVEDVEADREGEVALRIESLPDVRVPGDPMLLILHNLVENAVKYADPGKAERWVRIHGERAEDGHLVVHVGDNGLGIPESEQERVFARFRRGQRAPGDGYGLGLAIVRQAARQIGARVMIESEPGGGSTFSVSVPADQLQAD